jgi:heterodisulfide reductase subunit A
MGYTSLTLTGTQVSRIGYTSLTRGVHKTHVLLYMHESLPPTNIREQVSWAHHSDPGGATAKSMRMIAAAVGKLRHAEPLETIRISNNRQALVIGGGIAGLKAASDLAGNDIPVILLEKTSHLGGRVGSLGKIFPSEIEAAKLVKQLVDDVSANSLIRIYTQAQLTALSGFLGNFDATIVVSPEKEVGFEQNDGFRVGAESQEIRASVGAILVATGFDPYVPAQNEFGFGSPQVISMPDFIQLMRGQQGSDLKINGRVVRAIGFLHCVGSRQVDGVHAPQADGKINDYCSRTCCTTILQQAIAVKRRLPGVRVYDFHQDIRTYGRGHEEYYKNASSEGVVLMRYHGDEPPVVRPGDHGRPLTLELKDWLTFGEEVEVPLDLLVLGVGMIPRDIKELVNLIKLPLGSDRFLQEVHPKLRPVEVSVNGVLLAGTAQGPMNVEETLSAASSAASKAFILLRRDVVELDPFVAEVDADKCIGCDRCIAECEYTGALVAEPFISDGATLMKYRVNPGLCSGCGACAAVCPTRAIDLKGWTLSQFDAMVDGLVAELPEFATAKGH